MAHERVLVVDDNPANLKLAWVILVGEGYEVRTAVDAADALRVLEEFTPQLILMDLQMPGMSGFELTRLLRQREMTAHIPIIALTAYAMRADEEAAFAAGCSGFIPKPIDTRSLAAMVRGHLEEASHP